MHQKNFKWASKAQTLHQLSFYKANFSVPDLIYFSKADWEKNECSLLKKVSSEFNNKSVAVRSSSFSEDQENNSKAGEFISFLNLNANDEQGISNAVYAVFESYENFQHLEDEVIIQLMVENVSASGVIFTRDLSHGSPYFVINYDDFTKKTDTVTSGKINGKTLYINHERQDLLKSPRFRSVFKAVSDICKITKSDALDIEFALDEAHQFSLLQVRKISTTNFWSFGLSTSFNTLLSKTEKQLEKLLKKEKGVVTAKTVLSDMSDWNPAEMIGSFPRLLDSSLYQSLITDKSWHTARKQMAYAVPSHPKLMVMVSGRPYIDVRCSLNSFLPKALNPKISDKLVNFWIRQLTLNPELHDKIEFKVAITTHSFDFNEKLNALVQDSLDLSEKLEFEKVSLNHTRSIIEEGEKQISECLESVKILERKRELILDDFKMTECHLSTASSLLEDCKNYGVIPFAKLARHGFIAKELMDSLIRLEAISFARAELFSRSIKTVASDFLIDLQRLNNETLTFGNFILKYGHLRPGTYDILSKRYDEQDKVFFKNSSPKNLEKISKSIKFSLSPAELYNVDKILSKYNYNINSEALFRYFKLAAQAREQSKFLFSKNLSDVLALLQKWGRKNNFSSEDLSHLKITDILSLKNGDLDETQTHTLRTKIKNNKREFYEFSTMKLGSVIAKIEDLYVIPLKEESPNFVGKNWVEGPVFFLDGYSDQAELTGKIIVLERADPGFDWIFKEDIKGLITKFGGANSHMAIRCAEFDIPAAIGCGEKIYDKLNTYNRVKLDCLAHKITRV